MKGLLEFKSSTNRFQRRRANVSIFMRCHERNSRFGKSGILVFSVISDNFNIENCNKNHLIFHVDFESDFGAFDTPVDTTWDPWGAGRWGAIRCKHLFLDLKSMRLVEAVC